MGAQTSRTGLHYTTDELLQSLEAGDHSKFVQQVADNRRAVRRVLRARNGDTGIHIMAAQGMLEGLMETMALVVRAAELEKGSPLNAADVAKCCFKVSNLTNDRGRTPLMLASKGGHEDIVGFLLEHQANVWLRDRMGGAHALHYAASAGQDSCVTLLVEHSNAHPQPSTVTQPAIPLVDLGNANGLTPLHYAVWHKRHRTVALLLEHGASLYACSTWATVGDAVPCAAGSTPLHVAALSGSARCTKAIMKAYALASARSQEAREAGHPEPPVVDPRLVQDRQGSLPFAVALARGHNRLLPYLHPFTPLEEMFADDRPEERVVGVPRLVELAAMVAQRVLLEQLDHCEQECCAADASAAAAAKPTPCSAHHAHPAPPQAQQPAAAAAATPPPPPPAAVEAVGGSALPLDPSFAQSLPGYSATTVASTSTQRAWLPNGSVAFAQCGAAGLAAAATAAAVAGAQAGGDAVPRASSPRASGGSRAAATASTVAAPPADGGGRVVAGPGVGLQVQIPPAGSSALGPATASSATGERGARLSPPNTGCREAGAQAQLLATPFAAAADGCGAPSFSRQPSHRDVERLRQQHWRDGEADSGSGGGHHSDSDAVARHVPEHDYDDEDAVAPHAANPNVSPSPFSAPLAATTTTTAAALGSRGSGGLPPPATSSGRPACAAHHTRTASASGATGRPPLAPAPAVGTAAAAAAAALLAAQQSSGQSRPPSWIERRGAWRARLQHLPRAATLQYATDATGYVHVVPQQNWGEESSGGEEEEEAESGRRRQQQRAAAAAAAAALPPPRQAQTHGGAASAASALTAVEEHSQWMSRRSAWRATLMRHQQQLLESAASAAAASAAAAAVAVPAGARASGAGREAGAAAAAAEDDGVASSFERPSWGMLRGASSSSNEGAAGRGQEGEAARAGVAAAGDGEGGERKTASASQLRANLAFASAADFNEIRKRPSHNAAAAARGGRPGQPGQLQRTASKAAAAAALLEGVQLPKHMTPVAAMCLRLLGLAGVAGSMQLPDEDEQQQQGAAVPAAIAGDADAASSASTALGRASSTAAAVGGGDVGAGAYAVSAPTSAAAAAAGAAGRVAASPANGLRMPTPSPAPGLTNAQSNREQQMRAAPSHSQISAAIHMVRMHRLREGMQDAAPDPNPPDQGHQQHQNHHHAHLHEPPFHDQQHRSPIPEADDETDEAAATATATSYLGNAPAAAGPGPGPGPGSFPAASAPSAGSAGRPTTPSPGGNGGSGASTAAAAVRGGGRTLSGALPPSPGVPASGGQTPAGALRGSMQPVVELRRNASANGQHMVIMRSSFSGTNTPAIPAGPVAAAGGGGARSSGAQAAVGGAAPPLPGPGGAAAAAAGVEAGVAEGRRTPPPGPAGWAAGGAAAAAAAGAGGGGAAGGGGGNVPVQQVLTRVLTLLRSATATRALAAAGADGEPLELDGGDGEERRRGEEEEDEEEDEEETCGVCLDTGTFVDIMGCRHRLCVVCAKELVRLHDLKPALCPFCRRVIQGFTPAPRAPPSVGADGEGHAGDGALLDASAAFVAAQARPAAAAGHDAAAPAVSARVQLAGQGLDGGKEAGAVAV